VRGGGLPRRRKRTRETECGIHDEWTPDNPSPSRASARAEASAVPNDRTSTLLIFGGARGREGGREGIRTSSGFLGRWL